MGCSLVEMLTGYPPYVSFGQPEWIIKVIEGTLPYDPKKLVHRPVLLRVFDPSGQPAAGIELDATFSNGPVLDDVKATTENDGTAVMELLPGRSSLSLNRHGCVEQVERADVAPGVGVDNFKFVFECQKK